MTEQHTA